MAINIADVVRVTTRVLSGGTVRREFGRTLFVGTGNVLSAAGAGKVETFADFESVAARFPAASEEYAAAQAYFGQVPRPRNLLIGRWAQAAVPTTLTGGAPAAAATIQAISDGSLVLGGVEFSALDFSSAATYANQAGVLQAALRASADARFTNAEVQFTGGVFVITLPSHGDLGGVATAGTTGTDVSDDLGFNAASNAVFILGTAAESISEALDAIAALDGEFYFVGLQRSAFDAQPMLDAARWTTSTERMLVAGGASSAALVTGESASVVAQIGALESARVIGTFSRAADYKCMSVAARLASIDFRLPGAYTTLNLRQLPGFAADTYTDAQQQELGRKRWNYYTQGYDGAVYAPGFTTHPRIWADVQYWLDWVVGEVQASVWRLLRNANAVPQNQSGALAVRNVVGRVLELGVLNGGLTPGDVSPGLRQEIATAIGQSDFDGHLSTGYLIWTGAPADRALPMKVWMKGAGAIHEVAVDLNIEA